jgi:chromosome segregation ATPase
MKPFAFSLAAVFAVSSLFAGGGAAGKSSCEQRKKEENLRSAAKYAECAKQYCDAKLSKCYAKASQEVRAAASKEVELKKKLGQLFQQLSEAYKNSDMDSVKKLRGEKREIERSMDLARRKTKMTWYLSEINEKLKKIPDSQALKDLKSEITSLSEKYLRISEEINAKTRERSDMESKMRELRDELRKTFWEEKKKRRSRASCKSKKKVK